MNFGLSTCSAAGACISDGTAIGIFLIVTTSFALGYGIGQAVLWVRRLSEAA